MSADHQTQQLLKEGIIKRIVEVVNLERMRFGIMPLHIDRAGNFMLQDLLLRAPDVNNAAESIHRYFTQNFKPNNHRYLAFDSSLLLHANNKSFDSPITPQNVMEKTLFVMDVVFPANRDDLLSKQYNCVGIELLWTMNRIKLLVLLTNQHLAVESIYTENDNYFVCGYLHSPTKALYCAKLFDHEHREAVIGSNRISYSNDQARFCMELPQFLIRGLDLEARRPPTIEFYHLPEQQGGNNMSSHRSYNLFNITKVALEVIYSMPFVTCSNKVDRMQASISASPVYPSRTRRESRFFEAEDVKLFQHMEDRSMDVQPEQSRLRQSRDDLAFTQQARRQSRVNLWNTPRPEVALQSHLRNRERRSNLFKNRSNSPPKNGVDLHTCLHTNNNRTPGSNSRRNRNDQRQLPTENSPVIYENSYEDSKYSSKWALSTQRKHLAMHQYSPIDDTTAENRLPTTATAGQLPNPASIPSADCFASTYNLSEEVNSQMHQQQCKPNFSDRLGVEANATHTNPVTNVNAHSGNQGGLFQPFQHGLQVPFKDLTNAAAQNNPMLTQCYIPGFKGFVNNAVSERINTRTNMIPERSATKQSPALAFPKTPRFKPVKNLTRYIGHSSKYERFTASLLRASGNLDDVAELDLQKIESLLPQKKSKRVDHFVELYRTMEMPDVILMLQEHQIKSHKMVLLASPWFKDQLSRMKSVVNEVLYITLPSWFRQSSFEKVLKFLYIPRFEERELKITDIITAREMLLMASVLELSYLMKLLVCRIIIPKMSKDLCIELLKDSYRQDENSGSNPDIWRTLHSFCREFFATHSKSIVSKYRSMVLSLEPELLFALLNRALIKTKDQDHVFELLSLLIENGFASNVLEILAKISKNCEKHRNFDSKHISCLGSILALNPQSCFETELIEVDSTQCTSVETEKQSNNKSPSQNNPQSNKKVRKHDILNHFEINMKRGSYGSDVEGSQSSSRFTQSDPTYTFKTSLSDFRSRTFVTEVFYTETQAWSLCIDIDNDQRVSLFLQERGPCLKTASAESANKEEKSWSYFTSARFTFQIKDEGNEYESTTFFSFPKDQFLAVGHRKFFNLPYLLNKNVLVVRVWVEEFSIYSCSLQHIASRFTDLWKDSEKVEEMKKDNHDKGYSNFDKQLMNQPPLNTDASHTDKRKRSLLLLEKNLARETSNLVAEGDFSRDKQSDAVIAAQGVNRIQAGQPISGGFQRHINHLETLTTQTDAVACSNPSCTSQLPFKSGITDLDLELGNKQSLSFYDLNPFDVYCLMLSDKLQIEHEKFLVYFLYKYVIRKPNEIVTLLVSGIRFTYLELSRIFNLGRDHVNIRPKPVFQSKD